LSLLRFNDDQWRRLAVKGRIVGRRRLGEFAGLVTPHKILRWYRELIAASTTARRDAGPAGLPSSPTSNSSWSGWRRTTRPGVHAAGRGAGQPRHQIGRNTIKRVLRRHGLEPAPAPPRRAVSEYVEHYHLERNHQGVGSRLLTPAARAVRAANENAPVERRDRLGGLLNFYYRHTA
jgi:hypothetical protein